jgi:hypothetical protein
MIAKNSPSKKNPLVAITKQELVQFYGKTKQYYSSQPKGIWMLLENTYGNDTSSLPAHFAKVRDDYGPFPNLGFRRFKILLNALAPTPEEIVELCAVLSKNSQQYVASFY